MDTSSLTTQPFHKGAEAELRLTNVDCFTAVMKTRVSKAYRQAKLDSQIRNERTLVEVAALHEAKAAGVKVPSIIGIELETNTILMTHVDGTMARDCLDKMSPDEATDFFESVGAEIGLLHAAGRIHGDLTTSNIIVTASGKPFMVDFGMSRRSNEAEDRGVDLHLLQRSITTSHIGDSSPIFKALARGYREAAGKKVHESSWRKAREIARRGRYFAIR